MKNKKTIDYYSCKLKYGASFDDYKMFQMDALNNSQKKTLITEKINRQLEKKYNDASLSLNLENEERFHQRFKKLIKHDWIILNGKNEEQFESFLQKHPVVIIKKDDEIEKIDTHHKNKSNLYQEFRNQDITLIEEVLEQHSDLSKLHPYSINTIHVITCKGNVVAAYLKIGNRKNITSAFHHGGLIAAINTSTGIIDYLAIDEKGQTYEKHPITKEEILWFQIPKWNRIKALCEKASEMIPELGYVSWEVCMGKKDPILIGATPHPNYIYYQLPIQRQSKEGLLPLLKEIENLEE